MGNNNNRRGNTKRIKYSIKSCGVSSWFSKIESSVINPIQNIENVINTSGKKKRLLSDFKHFQQLDVLDNHNKHLISSVAKVESIPTIIPTIAILISRLIAGLKIDDIKN